MIRNKKGFEWTTNNILSLIIAAFGLLLIAYAGYKLYGVLRNTEADSARTALDSVIAKADALKDGESNTFAVQGFKGSGNWYIVGFGKNEKIDLKPDKCSFKNCLCVCRNMNADSGREAFLLAQGDRPFLEMGGDVVQNTFTELLVSSCQDSGFCEDTGDFVPLVKSTFVYEKEMIGPNLKPLGPQYYPFITLDSSLNQVSLKKTGDSISIDYQGVIPVP